MQFCTECGMRIVKFVEKDGKNFGICTKGHITPLKDKKSGKEISEKKEITFESVVVIGKNQQSKEQTITTITCPHCGGRRSKFIRSFTPYGDEDQVNIIKCLDCGKNFRV